MVYYSQFPGEGGTSLREEPHGEAQGQPGGGEVGGRSGEKLWVGAFTVVSSEGAGEAG